MRCAPTQFERQKQMAKYIEGYFAVFGKVYNCGRARRRALTHAFDTLGDDIRALVAACDACLGAHKGRYAGLKVDTAYGLRQDGKQNDADAMNLYARIERGDVDQCSFRV